MASNFSAQYQPSIKYNGQENKGNDHQYKKLLIIQHIVVVSIIGIIKKTV